MNAEVGAIQTIEGVVPAVKVTLSERNLKTLLLTLNEEDNDVVRFIPEQGLLLVIASEPNDVHYADREAGLMGEKVELKLAAEELGNDDTLYVPTDLGENLQ